MTEMNTLYHFTTYLWYLHYFYDLLFSEGVNILKHFQVEHTSRCCYIPLHSSDFKYSSNFSVWGRDGEKLTRKGCLAIFKRAPWIVL